MNQQNCNAIVSGTGAQTSAHLLLTPLSYVRLVFFNLLNSFGRENIENEHDFFTGHYRVSRKTVDAQRDLYLVPEHILLLPPQRRNLEGTKSQIVLAIFFYLI